MWPKRWQHLHCSGPLGATYDSTDTRKPQSSVSERTFDTSDPRATDAMKWGWEGDPWQGPGRDVRIAAEWPPGLECSGIRAPLGRRSQAYLSPDSLPGAAHSGPLGEWKCGSSHRPSRQGTAVRWPKLWTRQRLMGNHQPLALYLGRQTARAGRPQPGREGTGVTKTWNKNGLLIMKLFRL